MEHLRQIPLDNIQYEPLARYYHALSDTVINRLTKAPHNI